MERYFYKQDDYSADSRESVNGAWNRMGFKPSSFDGLDFIDEYDNFLSKKSRERGKERRELRKSGLSRKEARKQALAKIPKDKLKDVAKKVSQGVGKGILKGALATPRGAYLSLIAINYRGNAYKIMAIVNGKDKTLQIALKKKWEALGGNYDKLVQSAKNGATKPPFFCGKKCKQNLLNADLSKSVKPTDTNFVNAIGSGKQTKLPCRCGGGVRGYCGDNVSCKQCCANLDFVGDEFLNVAGFDDVAIGTWVALAGTMIGTMGTIVGKGIEALSQKKAIESAELIALKENESLTQAERDKIALKEKELASEGDATNLILNNPNLTPEERAIALKQLDDAESEGTKRNVTKFLLYGGIAVLGYFLVTKLISNK